MTLIAPRHERVRTSAHRGDSSRFRENTLPAIRSAVHAGADFIEVDVRLTVDRQVVVVHDPTLERLWNINRPIAEMTLTEVRALGDADNRPPLLTEVLDVCSDTGSTLLIDMDFAEVAAPAYACTVGSAARVAWCGNLEGMRVIRSRDPEARIWMPWERTVPPTPEDIGTLRPEAINMPGLAVTPGLVEAIHSHGYDVTVWTLDDEAAMRWAVNSGVDTITTNYLHRLQTVIAGVVFAGSANDMAQEPDDHRAGIDLPLAQSIARQLAEWAIDFTASTSLGVVRTKNDLADLVTEVDTAVERHVREVIGQYFPDHDFVGEEEGGSAHPGTPCWYLDPVDGTANLANGIPWTAFSLALVLDHTPLVAVVADPWRRDLFQARLGCGATLNDHPLSLTSSPHAPGQSALAGTIVTTELANQHPWPGMLPLLELLGERFVTLRIMGSGTLTLTGISAARATGAVIGRFSALDHVAALLIVHEAGGVILDTDGHATLFPDHGGILAAHPDTASELYALWQRALGAA